MSSTTDVDPRLAERKFVRQRARALLRKFPFNERAIRDIISRGVGLVITNLVDEENLVGKLEYRDKGRFKLSLDLDIESMGTPYYRSITLLHELAHAHFLLLGFDEGKPLDRLDPYELFLDALARSAIKAGRNGGLTSDDWLFLCHHNQYANRPTSVIQERRRSKALRTLGKITQHDPIDLGIVEGFLGSIKLVAVASKLETHCPARNLALNGRALHVRKRWPLTTLVQHVCHSIVHLHYREQLRTNEFPFADLDDPVVHPYVEEETRPWVGHDRVRAMVKHLASAA